MRSPHPLLVVVLLALTACLGGADDAPWRRGETVEQLVMERVTRADSGARIDLRDLVPFRWDALHVLAPGAPLGDAATGAPASWPGRERLGAAVPDSTTLLLFTAGADVIAAALLPRPLVEVSPSGRRFAPDSATFHAAPAGERRWRLEWMAP